MFDLYGIDYGMSKPEIELKRMQYLYCDDKEFQAMIDNIKRAHSTFMRDMIQKNATYTMMELNPLHSRDAIYGVPKSFFAIMDTI